MNVSTHAETALVALTQKMPVPASAVMARLRAEPTPAEDIAIVACRMTIAYGTPHVGSNGDTVVIIVRRGEAKTAMLRRSYNQSFAPEILRVGKVITWEWAQWANVARALNT